MQHFFSLFPLDYVQHGLLYFVVGFIPATLILHWLYAAATHFWRLQRDGTLTKAQRLSAGPLLVLADLWDIAYNWTYGIVVFFDVTRDPTLSQRLKRYAKQGDTRRAKMAKWLDASLLASLDPTGSHID
jgi:hypothetical protein